MSVITYETPLVPESGSKPMALSNKRFPYYDLADDRRFEDFLYSLVKSEIRHKGFAGFDNIALMNGSNDLGRDCALFKSGKNHGVIQCKKSRDVYAKSELGKEIVKFALYAILYPELVNDPDDFVYYIAPAYGLDRRSIDLIADFNSLIQSEKAVDNWIKANLKLARLQSLALQDVKPQVLDLLSRIKVKQFDPTDLDELLIKPNNQHLMPLFFEVKTVFIDREPSLSVSELAEKLNLASVALRTQRNEFEGIPASHIERNETKSLYQWVVSEQEKESIALLAANPGMGKTVIMKDLYDQLQQEKIPVLALKADQVFASNIKGIDDKLGISISLHELIKQCKANFTKTVILIDQIDALSQSLSADRSLISTYTQFIGAYQQEQSIRIIISVRLFDLNYDPALKVYRNVKTFDVKKLDLQSVLSELQKLGISRDQISQTLFELLATPNHLDIFSRIYKGKINFAGLNSTTDLYDELWAQKILGKSERLPELVYEIADQMYASQQITVNAIHFEADNASLQYLQSEQLIKSGEQGLQFFHQSFYDYVFARRFIKQQGRLTSFLKNEEQSIFCRSALKMIVNQMRSSDHRSYTKQIDEILSSRKYHFHIQHLLISFLAAQNKPSPDEIELVKRRIFCCQPFTQVFYDQVFGKEWINFLLDGDRLKSLAKPLAAKKGWFFKKDRIETANERLTTLFHILRRNLNQSPDKILDLIADLPDETQFRRLLFGLEDWTNPKATSFLDRIYEEDINPNVNSYGLLEQVATVNPNYVFAKVRGSFFDRPQNNSYQHSQDRETRVYEALFEKIPLELCNYAIGVIETEVPKQVTQEIKGPLLFDLFISSIDLPDEDSISRRENFYKLFARELRKYASERNPVFLSFLNKHINSPYRSIVKLIVYCLRTNESLYVNETFELIFHLRDAGVFGSDSRLNYDLRQLQIAAYPHMSSKQQSSIKEMITTMKVPTELFKAHWFDGKIHSIWGLTQLYFLQALPDGVVENDISLSQLMMELRRRHGEVKEKRPQPIVTIGSSPPLNSNAYLHMQAKEWIKSFRKYDRFYGRRGERSRNGSFGGLYEHSDAFLKATLAEPAKHAQIIAQIIDDNSIELDYPLKGIQGLEIASYDKSETLSLFKKLLQRDIKDSQVTSVLALAEKIADPKKFDADILDYVIDQALHHPNPDPGEIKSFVKDPKSSFDLYVQAGSGSTRAFAARILLHITDTTVEKKVFEAVEQLFANDGTIVKAVVIYHFAYLMNLNKQRTFDLFVRLVNDPKHKDIRACTLWSLQYLINYDFQQLVPLLQGLVVSEQLLAEDLTWLSTILFAASLFDYPQAKSLHNRFLHAHAETWQHSAQSAIKHFYVNENEKIAKPSYDTLKYIFKAKRKVKDFYLYDLETIKFDDFAPLLKDYVRSPVFRLSEKFIEYLSLSTPIKPVECMELFDQAISNRYAMNDEHNHFYHQELATKFILGTLSILKPKQKRYRKKMLRAFDKILLDPRFRNDADRILENVLT